MKNITNDIIKEIIPYVKNHLEQRWLFEMDGKTIFFYFHLIIFIYSILLSF